MKKVIFLSALFLFVSFSLCFAYTDKPREPNTVVIMSGQTIAAGGTSTYVIDLKDDNYYPILIGEPFSLQFGGVTCAWVVGSSVSPMGGATINASFRVSNRMPSGNHTIVKGLLTGTTKITST